jgi:NitT/TauT family transport system substrate-binding protein
MKKEFDTRPTFNLATQVKQMDRAAGNSQMDAWFAQIAVFMRETGALPSIPQVQDFVTGEYMNMVQADPKLRDFANNTK